MYLHGSFYKQIIFPVLDMRATMRDLLQRPGLRYLQEALRDNQRKNEERRGGKREEREG